eukprot:TRINITY_DN9656_c2_g1_i2.p1 TRINITY_DN9656_c2_g1~~TRINITY_DN9656_c2_g1_i2.p1  ORF type:complete len:425 (-),score=110.58 TRINITY_DN9656_c2_g1_i2:409-1683(-)
MMEGLRGQMMNFPLTMQHAFHKNETLHAKKPIISYLDPQKPVRILYSEFAKRTRQLANVLLKMGVKRGDRVATLAFNHHQHLELYFAIPMIGAVTHTLNIRLFADQLTYIVNHAEDKMIFLDCHLAPLIEGIQDAISNTTTKFIFLGTKEQVTSQKTTLKNVVWYEDLIRDAPTSIIWPQLHEDDASCLCYTSGTTGNPKGVLYSHRSTFLSGMVNVMTHGIRESDVVLPIVPMFHVNAWGLPFASVMFGCTLVLLGKDLSPPAIMSILTRDHVTIAAGVPTIWLGVLQEMRRAKFRRNSDLRLLCGGTALPVSLMDSYKREFDISFTHAWGMTETSPLGTANLMKGSTVHLSEAELSKLRSKQGYPMIGSELRIMSPEGKELPWDGKKFRRIANPRTLHMFRILQKRRSQQNFAYLGWMVQDW